MRESQACKEGDVGAEAAERSRDMGTEADECPEGAI
jgi:hypothetical protein